MSNPPAKLQSPPIEKFLATVLSTCVETFSDEDGIRTPQLLLFSAEII